MLIIISQACGIEYYQLIECDKISKSNKFRFNNGCVIFYTDCTISTKVLHSLLAKAQLTSNNISQVII